MSNANVSGAGISGAIARGPEPRPEAAPLSARAAPIEDAELEVAPAPRPWELEAAPRAAREHYRLIALRLERELPAPGGGRVVVVTSPTSGDGKTTTAIYLAAALARELGRTVALVDGDLAQPRLARPLGLAARQGLGDVVAGRARLDEVLWRLEDAGLVVVPGAPAGPAPPVRALAPVLAALRRRHDWVLVDTPALAGSADAAALGRLADGVVVVVRPGRTLRSDLAAALGALEGAHLAGLVVNDHQAPLPPPGRRSARERPALGPGPRPLPAPAIPAAEDERG